MSDHHDDSSASDDPSTTDDSPAGDEAVPVRDEDSASADRDPASTDGGFDAPTISCRRCDREWDLTTEFDDLGVGSHAVEQFALDHQRHTGHFPDDVATWRAKCRNCPEEVERLSNDAATRWAETHARHTRHAVEIRHARDDETTVIEPESE